MQRILTLAVSLAATVVPAAAESMKIRVYELRTYYAAEGKLDALHARFRDHTCALFEKHGISNLGYWVPVDNPDNKVIYLVGYPSREAREVSWKAFFADPAWTVAYRNSTKNGKLVMKVDRTFVAPTDYSPEPRAVAADPPRLFEMRTYTTRDRRLQALHARFRNHTCALFEKHGMTNVLYTEPVKGEAGAGNTLIYFLAHKDEESRQKSFDAFRSDPAWQQARKASEEDGPILVEEGVQSVLLQPTDYSPMR